MDKLGKVFWFGLLFIILGIVATIAPYTYKSVFNVDLQKWWAFGLGIASVIFNFGGIIALVTSLVSYFQRFTDLEQTIAQLSADLVQFTTTSRELSDKFDRISTELSDNFNNSTRELSNNFENAKDEFTNNLDNIKNNLSDKFDNVAIWRTEQLEEIEIQVCNMDNYFIHIPFHLAQKSFLAERLNFKPNNRYNDKAAITQMLDNNGGFAIADPFYVTQFSDEQKKQLLILSPIITKYPFNLLINPNITSGDIFVYDRTSDSTAGRVKVEGTKNIKEVINDLKIIIDRLQNDSFNKLQSLKDKLKNAELTNAHYELFLEILNLLKDGQVINTQDKNNEIKSYFEEKFWKFLLMEPELSLIKSLTNFAIDNSSLKNTDNIFTSVISTRDYVFKNPIIVLKFLKALRVGILKTKTLLSNGSHSTIIEEYIEILKKEEGKDFLIDFLQNTHISIDNELYPKDLVMYDVEDTTHLKELEKIVVGARHYVLSKSDIRKEEIIFIKKHLGC